MEQNPNLNQNQPGQEPFESQTSSGQSQQNSYSGDQNTTGNEPITGTHSGSGAIISSEVAEPVADTICKNCRSTVPAGQKFCTRCGFPVNATPEEEDNFFYRQGAKQMDLDSLEKTVSNARTALWVIAGAMAVFGIGMFMMDNGAEYASATLITNLIVAGLFVGLGFWAKEKPFTALLTGLILYITLYLFGVIVGGMNPVSGIIVRIIIIVYLVKGINSAKEAEQLKKELNR